MYFAAIFKQLIWSKMEKLANMDGKRIYFDVECFRFGDVRLNELHIAIV